MNVGWVVPCSTKHKLKCPRAFCIVSQKCLRPSLPHHLCGNWASSYDTVDCECGLNESMHHHYVLKWLWNGSLMCQPNSAHACPERCSTLQQILSTMASMLSWIYAEAMEILQWFALFLKRTFISHLLIFFLSSLGKFKPYQHEHFAIKGYF